MRSAANNWEWRRVARRRLFVVAAILFGSGAAPVGAVLWDGGGVNSEWIEPANWQFNMLPTTADTATIVNDTATITGVVVPTVMAAEIGLGSLPGGLVIAGGVNPAGLNVVTSVAVAGGGSLTLGGGGPAPSQVTAGSLSTGGMLSVLSRGTVSVSGQLTQSAGVVNLNGGTINAGTVLSQAGLFQASGEINANASIGDGGGGVAALALGRSLEVNGNMKLASDGRLEVEFRPGLGGGAFEMLDVSGTMTLGGVLDLSALGGAAPVPGVMYPMLTAGAIEGRFDDIVGSAVGGGSWVPHFDVAFTSINFSESDLPGDMNADSSVDELDAELFAYAIRDPNTYHAEYYLGFEVADSYMADMDGDGSNTFADIPPFLDVVEQFGGNSQMALAGIVRALASVPEPGSAVLGWGLTGGAWFLVRRIRGTGGNRNLTGGNGGNRGRG